MTRTFRADMFDIENKIQVVIGLLHFILCKLNNVPRANTCTEMYFVVGPPS